MSPPKNASAPAATGAALDDQRTDPTAGGHRRQPLTPAEWVARGVLPGPAGFVHGVCRAIEEHGITVDEIVAMSTPERVARLHALTERPAPEPAPAEVTATDVAVILATELGFKVFPANPRTKRPAIHTGRDHAEHASHDPAGIRSWFDGEHRGAAIGVTTGAASGIVVIDADKKHDGERVLAELEGRYGALDRSFVVRTQSGGIHLYLRHPGGGRRVKSLTGDRAPWKRAGVDVRGDGGIVLVPPSLGYSWEASVDGAPFPELPAGWLAALEAPARRELEPVEVGPVEYNESGGDLEWCREILRYHRRRYRTGKRDGDVDRAEILDRVLTGKALAQIGGRDAAVTRLGYMLGRLLPGIGPDSATDLACNALLAMPYTSDGEGYRHWCGKLARAYEAGALARREDDERERLAWGRIAETLRGRA